MKAHLGDLLTISTGKLFSPNGMDGVRDILEQLTGIKAYAHQIPALMDRCRPLLCQQLPWLESIDPNTIAEGAAEDLIN